MSVWERGREIKKEEGEKREGKRYMLRQTGNYTHIDKNDHVQNYIK